MSRGLNTDSQIAFRLERHQMIPLRIDIDSRFNAWLKALVSLNGQSD